MTALVMHPHRAPETDADAPQRCVLRQALGRVASCERQRCALWEHGGAILQPGCVLSRTPLDLAQPGVAARLLGLRRRIERPASPADARAAHGELRRAIAAAFSDDME